MRVGRECGTLLPHIVTTSYLTHDWIEQHLAREGNYQYPGPLLLSPGRIIGLRMVPLERDLRFAWEEMPQQMLDEHFDFILGDVGPRQRFRCPDSGPFDPARVLESGSPDLVLLCQERGQTRTAEETERLRQTEPPVQALVTKCDLPGEPSDLPACSTVTGKGLESLRELLRERACGRSQPALAPSLSRCRHHVETCLGHLRQAHAVALNEDPPELLALELRGALDQLGEMVGAVYTDDLLDRIFSRFCIGK